MMENAKSRGADDDTNERPARARPRLALALASVAVLMACAYVFHALLVSPRSTATKGISEPASAPVLHTRSLEKTTNDGCKLAMFIPMTACKKDVHSAGCCSALRTILNAGCICKELPPVVVKNGGVPLSFVDNFLRCRLHDGKTDPIDHLTAQTPCMDREEWCADKRHARDIRLDAYPRGRVQMWDHAAGWLYVTPKRLDASGALVASSELATARFVCRALGFHNATGWGYTDHLGSRTTGFAMACPDSAFDSRDVRECNPLELNSSYVQEQPMWASCASNPGLPDMCVRPADEVLCASKGALTGVRSPLGDTSHLRAVGAAHMLCGTGGINESRIAWRNGLWEDERAYVRAHGYYPVPPIELWRGERPGKASSTVAPLPAGTWDFDPRASPPPSLHMDSSSPPAPPSPLPAGDVVAFGPPPSLATMSSSPSLAPPPLGVSDPVDMTDLYWSLHESRKRR